MTPIEFPYALLKPRAYSFDIVGGAISGGISNSGQQQVVNSGGGGLWALRMDGFIIRSPAQIRAWRRVQYGAQSGVVPINVQVCEVRTAPPFVGVPHSDTTPFSDGGLYRSMDGEGVTTAAANSRATSMFITLDSDADLYGGELFSIEYQPGYHSLHAITNSVESGSGYLITFEPPLRSAAPAETVLNFTHPTVTVRLANPDAMSMSLELGKFSNTSATFIEYFGGAYVPPQSTCEPTNYDFAELMQELVN